MRIAIDAMSGDNAPKEIVLGAMEEIAKIKDLQITIVSDEDKIKEHLTDAKNIDILHTTEMIMAEDEPVRAVRRKKNASMVLMANEVKRSEEHTSELQSRGHHVCRLLLHKQRIEQLMQQLTQT